MLYTLSTYVPKEKSPGIFERGRKWMGNVWGKAKAQAEELSILAQVRYEIATGPMKGGSALDFQGHTQRAWKDQKRWLSAKRQPPAPRVLKREMPYSYNESAKEGIAETAKPKMPMINRPSSIPNIAELVRLQVLSAVSGNNIAEMRARYTKVPVTTIHEVLRRDSIRFGKSPDGVRLGVRQQLRTAEEQGGVFITHPIFNGKNEGQVGLWKPEYTINPELAPRPTVVSHKYTRTVRPSSSKPADPIVRDRSIAAVKPPKNSGVQRISWLKSATMHTGFETLRYGMDEHLGSI